jgi:hypothetical protein
VRIGAHRHPIFLTGLLAARLMMGESRYIDPLIWGVKGG